MDARLRRAAGLAADYVDPIRLVGHVPTTPPPMTLLSVYRRRNAANVTRLIEDTGCPARTWALDDAHPALPTFGTGAGSRFALLNRLAVDVPADHTLLIADDDVRLPRGGLRRFAALTHRLGFSLAMPAHSRRGSHYFHRITRRHPFRIARETTFVEIGPVLAVSAEARPVVTPFPEEGMGWGTELEWFDLQQAGRLRLGIIDATPMRHLAAPGGAYDAASEEARWKAMFAARGLSGWTDVQHTVRSVYL